MLRRVVTIYQKAPDPEPQVFAAALENLATLLVSEKKYAEAEPLARQALAIHEKLGPDEAPTAASLNTLGALLVKEGHVTDLQSPLLQRALDIDTKRLGQDHPVVALASGQPRLCAGAHRAISATRKRFTKNAMLIDARVLGPDHPDSITAIENFSVFSAHQGHADVAVAGLRIACASRAARATGVSRSLGATAAFPQRLQRLRALCSRGKSGGGLEAGGGKAATDQPAALEAEGFVAAQRAMASAADEALSQASARAVAASSDPAWARRRSTMRRRLPTSSS